MVRFYQFSKGQTPCGIYITTEKKFVNDKLTSDVLIGNLSEEKIEELVSTLEKGYYDFTKMEFQNRDNPIYDEGRSLPYFNEATLGVLNFLLEENILITSPDFGKWVAENYFMEEYREE